MSFLGKTYHFVKQENFDNFLKHHGVPDDRVESFLKYAPTVKIVKNGDTYTHIVGDKETTFTSGVQFDDVIGASKTPVKTTYTVDGNVVTQVVSNDKSTSTFKREFNGDDLVVTITSNTWDGVSKRYYKA